MKVAISATGDNLQAQVDQAFGRCNYFIIYDSDTDTHQAIPNPGSDMSGSAGPTAAQTVIEQGATQVFTGRVGTKARPVLEGAGITIVENQTGVVADIIATIRAATRSNNPGNPGTIQDTAPAGGASQSNRNPAGYCFCPSCGYEHAGDPDLPCFKQRCPQCNCGLERKYN